MNKRIIGISIGVVACLVIYFFFFNKKENKAELFAEVKKGEFKVIVTTTGEMKAQNSIEIYGPTGVRNAQIWNVKVNSIVAEGTVVKKDDIVAELDRSELLDKVKQRQNELLKVQSQFTQTQLDTTLTLREARDKLVQMQFSVEEKKLVLEQSAFEPPATIKQAKIDLARSERDYSQAKENYKVKVNQAIAKMQEVSANLAKEQDQLNMMQNIMADFTIKAPEEGMFIYTRDWDGKKVKEGSTINVWRLVVGELPDLRTMVSKTYVNEIDIRRIAKDQKVEIGLDAFPEKKLTGKVISVSNVGEQRPNSEAKVFEVEILVNESDTTLRPAMTTSNAVITQVIPNALYVPLEAIHSQGDSVSYVFKKDGISYVKQEVKLGATNENEVVILEGLQEKQVLLLSKPEDSESMELQLLPKKTATAQLKKP